MRGYTMNEMQRIVDAVWARAYETFKNLHPDAPVPAPPNALEVVDHPFHGSDAKGQFLRPWLNDPRGMRGIPRKLTTGDRNGEDKKGQPEPAAAEPRAGDGHAGGVP